MPPGCFHWYTRKSETCTFLSSVTRLLAHCTFKASMPESRVFVSWSLMMMKGLPYSSNASVPKADIFTDVQWHLIDLNRGRKDEFSDGNPEYGFAASRADSPATSGRLHGWGRQNHVSLSVTTQTLISILICNHNTPVGFIHIFRRNVMEK